MELNTIEKFLLLAKHPVKKRFLISEMHINYGIIGGILMEMSLENLIKIENKNLILEKQSNSSNYLVEDVTEIIQKSKKTRKIRYWMQKLSRYSKKYKWLVLNELSNKEGQTKFPTFSINNTELSFTSSFFTAELIISESKWQPFPVLT